ncbi:ferritin-like domain-containing protein [Patulibacter minatonensis]|uniref:YciE/YciF ferroxidase family protein n=1 Tax=Patulibacter minatonensis TaxID=298163 RepID=UPI0006868B8F|nr:DUF892 family protein [Patulibacter minatonensis]
MTTADEKIVQYLKEARASELALVRVLQSQIAMTPEGPFRSGLERHLGETRQHASRVHRRAKGLQSGFDPVALAIGTTEAVVGQALALAKTPLDLLRGSGGEEKVLKNAKDAAATEALEIATYTAIRQLAERAGDAETAELAESILRDEQRMLDRILDEIPRLTDAVFDADVRGAGSYDVGDTGAAQAAKAATTTVTQGAAKAKETATQEAAKAKSSAAAAATAAKAKTEEAADTVSAAAPEPTEDAAPEPTTGDDAPEHDDTDDKPWANYDELAVHEVRAVLLTADADLVDRVGTYERAHRARTGVLTATEPRGQKA